MSDSYEFATHTLKVSVELVESEHGYAAVPLLRPACEELLWLRYLEKLTADDAKLLAGCLIRSGLLRDLNAQAGEVGEEEMMAIGLGPALKIFRSKASDVQQKLRELGKRLGWSDRVVSKGSVPNTWFIAKTTDSTDLYRFLYHATSRYVHFSPVELARRGWGFDQGAWSCRRKPTNLYGPCFPYHGAHACSVGPSLRPPMHWKPKAYPNPTIRHCRKRLTESPTCH